MNTFLRKIISYLLIVSIFSFNNQAFVFANIIDSPTESSENIEEHIEDNDLITEENHIVNENSESEYEGPVNLPSFPDVDGPVNLPEFPDIDRPVNLPELSEDNPIPQKPQLPPDEPDNDGSSSDSEPIDDVPTSLSVGRDVTDLLMKANNGKEFFEIYQGSIHPNNLIPDGGLINFEKDIIIQYKFFVPTMNQKFEDQYVHDNDYIILKEPKGLKIEGNGAKDVTSADNTVIGKLNFSQNDSTLKLVFNENVNDPDIFEVNTYFNISLKYDNTGEFSKPGKHNIQIYDKNFHVIIPEKEPIITVQKSGSADLKNKIINWKVSVNAQFEEGLPGDLTDYVFEDDISNVGKYVQNSFKFNTTDSIETATEITDGLQTQNNKLIYTFPEEIKNQAFIYFKTEIPDEKYFKNGQSQVSNKAIIKKQNVEKANHTSNVNINNTWITKDGNTYIDDIDKSRYIDWTIEFNQIGYPLNGVKITDVVPEKTEFVSAKIETWNGSQWVEHSTISTAPSNNIYTVGDITSKARIILKTKSTSIITNTFRNKAILTWDNMPNVGEISAEKTLKTGEPPILKSSPRHNIATREVTWNVNFNLSNTGENYGDNVRLLDLIIYGNANSIDLENATIEGSQGNLTEVTTDVLKRLKRSYYQSYVNDSFTTSNPNIKLTVLKVKNGDTPVADLLVVTNSEGNGINSSFSYSYRTILNNPNHYATNSNNSVENTVELFDGDNHLLDTKGTRNINSKVMDKDMISIQDARNVEQNFDNISAVNGRNPGRNNAFDYINKTATFRIHINTNGTDLTHLGEMRIEDTMPNGWELKPINGEPFLLYSGTRQGNSNSVSAQQRVTDHSSIIKDYSATSGRLTFNFNYIDKSYVMLVKIGPNEETLKNYFSKNLSYNLKNTATLYNQNISSRPNDWEDFTISSNVLRKSIDSSNSSTDGYLRWTVNYTPYNLFHENARLRDHLPYGVELFKDKTTGEVDFNHIQLKELILQPNGNYELGKNILNVSEYVSYDDDNRDIILNFPDLAKGYRLIYDTEITGGQGTITNSVSIEGSDMALNGVKQDYSISSVDAGAVLKKGARFSLAVKDDKNKPIKNVEMGIFVPGADKPLRQSVSNGDGILDFRGLPEGDYIIKQTSTPNGYVQNANEIPVSVKKNSDGSFTITIDGQIIQNGGSIDFIIHSQNSVGSLKITKSLVGDIPELDREFEFTLTLDNENTFSYTKNNSTDNTVQKGKIKSGDTFNLKNGDSITIDNIPNNTSYDITETPVDKYTPDYGNNKSGVISEQTVKIVNVVNTHKIDPGTLVITKLVTGEDADLNKEFEFTLSLSGNGDNKSYPYKLVKNNVSSRSFEYDGFIKNNDTFNLKNGDGIYIYDLPMGIKYAVTENVEIAKGYTIEAKNETGSITYDKTQNPVIFINDKIPLTGDLKITKNVVSEHNDPDKKFTFNIELSSNEQYDYEKSDGTSGKIANNSSFTLKDNETITISGIKYGTKYKVTEDEKSSEGYIVTSKNSENVIIKNETQNVEFTNTLIDTGNLTITKKVIGTDADLNKDFVFNIELDSKEKYSYEKSDGTSGVIGNNDTFTLKNDETITIFGIEHDIKYKITENKNSSVGYIVYPKNNEDIIIRNETQQVTFVNVLINTGSLKIIKNVLGDDNSNRDFIFNIELGSKKEYNYVKSDDTSGKIKNNDTFSLKNGETITIFGIEHDTRYKITEDKNSSNGYIVSSQNSEGVTIRNTNHNVIFNNTLINNGNLKITNDVSGVNANLNKDFIFKFEIDSDKEYSYTKSDGTSGKIKNNDTFSLKNGETITIIDIEHDTKYKITESPESSKGYNVSSQNTENTIIRNDVQNVIFNHTSINSGGLKITNNVSGVNSNLNKDFIFKFEIDSDKKYSYTKSDGTSGKIKNNDTFSLKNGETITIIDIEHNTKYKITESPESSKGYNVSSQNTENTIIRNDVQNVIFNHTSINSGNVGDNTDSNNNETSSDSNDSSDTNINNENNNKNPNVTIDNNGNIVDKNGNVVDAIIVDKNGNVINKNDIKIDKNGNIIDKNGNIIDANIVDTSDKNKIHINVNGNIIDAVIVDKNGNVINKNDVTIDKNGNVIDKNGNIIDAVIVDKNGNVINKNDVTIDKNNNSNIVIDPNGNIVDKNGNIIDAVIVDKNGNVINKNDVTIDENGNVIDKNGNIIDAVIVDKNGNVINKNDVTIDKNNNSNVVIDPNGNIVDENGNIIDAVIVDKDGNIIDTNTVTIDKNGNIIDANGNIIDAVIVDKNGNIIDTNITDNNIVIDENGNIVDENGNVINAVIVDKNGNIIDASTVTIDKNGNIIDKDGNVINAVIIDENGNIINTNLSDSNIDNVIIDENGNIIDENGNVIDAIIIDKDGNIIDASTVTIDKNGNIIDKNGNIINAVIIDNNGNIINTNSNDNITIDENGNIIDKNGNVIDAIIIDKDGNIIDASTVTIDKNGNIIDKNGNIINAVIIDNNGNPINANIVNSNNISIDENGNIIDKDGNIIDAIIIDKDGNVIDINNITIDENGNIIDKDGNIINAIIVSSKRTVVNANNTITPDFDEHGNPIISNDGSVLTNTSAKPIFKNGKYFNENGEVVDRNGIPINNRNNPNDISQFYQTGDKFSIKMNMSIFAISLISCILLLIYKKKKL